VTADPTAASFRERFAGLDVKLPLLDGTLAPYINFDNAASTPALRSVREGVERFLDYYASVHRGTGFKSQLSTWAYEHARHRTLAFVGADPQRDVCIFGKNSTEAINKLARRLPLSKQDVILTTEMEHHSDDLPFRAAARVVHIPVLPDGRLDLPAFEAALQEYRGRLRLVAVTGASNVSGYVNPVHALAEKVHAAGALILVDCAQLAPHRKVDVRPWGDPAHLDFVVLSAHKLYAPYGTGALIGPRGVFEQGEPDVRGGGTVEIVTVEDVTWAGPPDRDEAGSPNVVGAVALALAIAELESIGMTAVAQHEAELTRHALGRLTELPFIRLFGDRDPGRAAERLGVIPIQVEGLPHFLVASILGHEFGIGVRSGCFCAHPYVLRLLGLSEAQAAEVRAHMLAGDRREMPGMVRISFGLYNTTEEIDRLIAALHAIAGHRYAGVYDQDRGSGEYRPRGWTPDFQAYLRL
jgi:selenocysteine lyase/cysteine desulfurase